MVTMPDQRFPKGMRLRSRTDFRRVYERKCWAGDSLVRIAGELGELPHARIGLSVGRVVGNVWATRKEPSLEGIRFLYYHCSGCAMNDIFVDILPQPGNATLVVVVETTPDGRSIETACRRPPC